MQILDFTCPGPPFPPQLPLFSLSDWSAGLQLSPLTPEASEDAAITKGSHPEDANSHWRPHPVLPIKG